MALIGLQEEEKDLGLNEEEDLTEEDEEENNSILLSADKPKIMDHSKIIPIDQEKIGLMNEGLGKQEDLIRKSYSKKLFQKEFRSRRGSEF